jgi:hypothetical protein
MRLAFLTFVLVNRHAAIIEGHLGRGNPDRELPYFATLRRHRLCSLPERCLTLLNLFL